MKLLSTEDAALACGVQPSTIRQWASRGKLTRHGTARSARYDLEELLAACQPMPRIIGACRCGSDQHSPLCSLVKAALNTPSASSGGQDT